MSIMKIREILRRTRAYINVDDGDSYVDFETVLLLASLWRHSSVLRAVLKRKGIVPESSKHYNVKCQSHRRKGLQMPPPCGETNVGHVEDACELLIRDDVDVSATEKTRPHVLVWGETIWPYEGGLKFATTCTPSM